jgi:hypothetical protein
LNDVRALLASPIGFVIGVALGALGGGGSILAVPALVYVAGQEPKAATSTSLVLVTLTALVGIVPHARAGRVHFGVGIVFALVGLAGNLIGSHLSVTVDGDVLLLAFAPVMLVAAALMYRTTRRRPLRSAGAAIATDRADHRPGRIVRVASAGAVLRIAGAGTVVGLLTGFFGVGGGFVIVPALVLAVNLPMTDAVGTSLLVIALNSLVAVGARFDHGVIDWGVVGPFALSSIAGVVAGSRLAGRHQPATLQRWFAGVLVAIALYTVPRSLLALG